MSDKGSHTRVAYFTKEKEDSNAGKWIGVGGLMKKCKPSRPGRAMPYF